MHHGLVSRSRDLVVNGCTDRVIDESERGSCVGNGGVVETNDLAIANRSGGTLILPEALRVIHISVVDFLSVKGFLVDEAKGVERPVVAIGCVFIRAQVGGKNLLFHRVVFLYGQSLGRCGHGRRADMVEKAIGQAQKPIAWNLFEVGRNGVG